MNTAKKLRLSGLSMKDCYFPTAHMTCIAVAYSWNAGLTISNKDLFRVYNTKEGWKGYEYS